MTAPVRLCIGLGGPTRIPPGDEYLLEKASFWEKTMQIDKAQLLQLLRYKGQHDQAHEAQQELPDKVDIDKHANQRSSSVSARPIYSGNSSAV